MSMQAGMEACSTLVQLKRGGISYHSNYRKFRTVLNMNTVSYRRRLRTRENSKMAMWKAANDKQISFAPLLQAPPQKRHSPSPITAMDPSITKP